MRQAVAAALVLALAACGRSDRSGSAGSHDAPSAQPDRGPDPLVLRVPRTGGEARVYAYPAVDSLVWTAGSPAPAIERVLAFDPDGGSVAYLDRAGIPGRMDLRLGDVRRAQKGALAEAASADGESIFGIVGGAVVRLTPSGDWSFKPPRPPRAVFPQGDGSLLVLATAGKDASIVWRMYTPETKLLDSAQLPLVSSALRTPVGDRLYVAAGEELVGLRSRTLERVDAATFDGPVKSLVASPSGDRLFVLMDDEKSLAIYDRFARRVRTIALPGTPTEVRVDPLGRYLLVHPQRTDSAWVVAIGTDQLMGAVPTQWRGDLPFVGVDGSVVTLQGSAVVLVDPETMKQRRRVADGAKDFWFPFRWSGFRPRAAGLDQPVNFDGVAPPDSTAADSAGAIPADTTTRPDTNTPPPGPPPAGPR